MVQIISFLLQTISDITVGIIEGLFDGLSFLFSKQRKTEYNADFTPGYELLHSSEHGFCLDGRRSISISNSTKNAVVAGATGNFKSSGILIPSLFRMKGHSSLVVTDFSGELRQKTSGAFTEAGYDVKVLNWGNPQGSEGFNPLYTLANDSSDVQKLHKIALHYALGSNSRDPFWQFSSEGINSLATRYILRHTSKEYHSLYNVYHLVSALSYSKGVDKMFLKADDPELLAELKSFLSYGEKVLSSVVATSRAALAIFGADPEVALTTSHHTIDFSSFRNRKTVLYINTNTKDMRYYSLVTSIFLQQFFGQIMSKLPETSELPIFFLIDEASSLYFGDLQIVISNIRKYNCGILQIYQSIAQLTELYGSYATKAILENCYARVFMSNQPISVAQELEATLGKFEWFDANEVRHLRPLMTADEIRSMDDALIFCSNKPAIRTPIVPYFSQRKLLRLSELPPYEPKNKLPFAKPYLLPIEE